MHKTKDELYQLIKDLKTQEEFNAEIKKRFQEYDELIEEDVIALYIVDELGRNKQVVSKIADLKPDSEYTIIGKITNILDLKTFKRKNGTSGKVVNLDLTDETGTCRLVMWNKDVERVKNKEIKIGTTVKIINGYTKNGYSGLEINLGKWGLIEVEPENIPEINIVKPEEKDVIKGTLIHREPTKAFFKDDGEFGFVTTIKIKDNNGEKQVTIWDKKVKEIQKFKIGDQITIKDINTKQINGKEELHVNGNSVIQGS